MTNTLAQKKKTEYRVSCWTGYPPHKSSHIMTCPIHIYTIHTVTKKILWDSILKNPPKTNYFL